MKSTSCRMSTIVQILLLFCTQILGRQNSFNSNPALIESNHKSVDPLLDRYQADWSSLDRRPIPPWYDHAKIGIFIHWGVYAVPAFGTEWFWTNWRTAEHPAYVEFMARNYPPGFTYQQFGPQLTAELFNATEWADLFAASGARYVVLTSKHHDGFTMWPSRYSFGWNAIDIGPHRDVVGELAAAVRQHSAGMRFGLYHSLMEWYNPMYLSDKKGEFAGNEFVTRKILPELKEIVQAYKPDVLWSDGDWEASDAYWNSTDFLAWLYNDSPVAGSVVTNDRWGSGTLCKHGDFFTCQDRYNPGVLQPHKWENAMTIDRGSWGHRVNAKLSDYLTTNELIAELVTTVSCGGNLLVNVGPNKAGTIEPIFEERLRQMGDWLHNNGDAVYESRPWIVQNDTRTPGVWYTTSKIQHKIVVHAMVLNYPLDSGIVRFYAINSKIEKPKHITMLGYPDQMQFEAFPDYLLVQFPPKDQLDRLGLAHAWTIQIRW